jgi:hypothetical protein
MKLTGPEAFSIRGSWADELGKKVREIFQVSPFFMHKSKYIAKLMKVHFHFYGIGFFI